GAISRLANSEIAAPGAGSDRTKQLEALLNAGAAPSKAENVHVDARRPRPITGALARAAPLAFALGDARRRPETDQRSCNQPR
ncbi:MAG TPA: hypothetical protein QF901_12985, partial [Gammaproteobacteria bacterium]|nr:hypothetical protein [Gammaproteobacteria bacterium]